MSICATATLSLPKGTDLPFLHCSAPMRSRYVMGRCNDDDGDDPYSPWVEARKRRRERKKSPNHGG